MFNVVPQKFASLFPNTRYKKTAIVVSQSQLDKILQFIPKAITKINNIIICGNHFIIATIFPRFFVHFRPSSLPLRNLSLKIYAYMQIIQKRYILIALQ